MSPEVRSELQVVGAAPPAAPVVTLDPVPVTVGKGGMGTFTSAATGEPPPTPAWESQPDGVGSWYPISSNQSDVPGELSTGPHQGAGYAVHCVWTNSEGTATSGSAMFGYDPAILEPPGLFGDPMDLTVAAGEDAYFMVNATASVMPTYQWEESVDGGTTWVACTWVGAQTQSISYTAVTPSMTGKQYRCVCTNPTGVTTSGPGTLTVT